MKLTPAQTKANQTYYKRNAKRANIQTKISFLKRKYPDSYQDRDDYKFLLKRLEATPVKKCKYCGGKPHGRKCFECGRTFDES